MKTEIYYGYEKDYMSFEVFSKDVDEYIDYYNNKEFNQNKMDASCTIQDNIHLYKLNIYVSRILGTHQNRFCRVSPAKFIRYLKSFHKANLDINNSLRL